MKLFDDDPGRYLADAIASNIVKFKQLSLILLDKGDYDKVTEFLFGRKTGLRSRLHAGMCFLTLQEGIDLASADDAGAHGKSIVILAEKYCPLIYLYTERKMISIICDKYYHGSSLDIFEYEEIGR